MFVGFPSVMKCWMCLDLLLHFPLTCGHTPQNLCTCWQYKLRTQLNCNISMACIPGVLQAERGLVDAQNEANRARGAFAAARDRVNQDLAAAQTTFNAADAAYTRAVDEANRSLQAARTAVNTAQLTYNNQLTTAQQNVNTAQETVNRLLGE